MHNFEVSLFVLNYYPYNKIGLGCVLFKQLIFVASLVCQLKSNPGPPPHRLKQMLSTQQIIKKLNSPNRSIQRLMAKLNDI